MHNGIFIFFSTDDYWHKLQRFTIEKWQWMQIYSYIVSQKDILGQQANRYYKLLLYTWIIQYVTRVRKTSAIGLTVDISLSMTTKYAVYSISNKLCIWYYHALLWNCKIILLSFDNGYMIHLPMFSRFIFLNVVGLISVTDGTWTIKHFNRIS